MVTIRQAQPEDQTVLRKIDAATWTPDVSPAPPEFIRGTMAEAGSEDDPTDDCSLCRYLNVRVVRQHEV
jgi:hypothetical protein